jgi:hypothetical protein
MQNSALFQELQEPLQIYTEYPKTGIDQILNDDTPTLSVI